MKKKKISVGDVVKITCRVMEIHDGYGTAKIVESNWARIDKLEKVDDAEAMLWILENTK